MPAAKTITLEKAKADKLFYFVATVVVYRESDGRCLLLKRSNQEIAHPGKWGIPGGKLEHSDLPLSSPTRHNGDVLDWDNAVEELCRREAREEAGIELGTNFKYLRSISFLRPDGVPVVCVKMAATWKSGEVVVEKDAFTEYAWVNGDELSTYDFITTVDDEVVSTIKHFSKASQKQVAVAVAAVVKDGQVLISKRRDSETPDADGRWELPAGKIEFGEDPESAAVREALEETGVTVRSLGLLRHLEHTSWKRTDQSHYHVLLLPYRCEVVSGKPTLGLDPKVSELKFVSKEELSSYDFLPGDREIALAALSGL